MGSKANPITSSTPKFLDLLSSLYCAVRILLATIQENIQGSFKRILSYRQFIWDRLIFIESPWTLNDLTFIMHMMCFKNIRLFLSSEVYQLGEFLQNFAFRQKQMAAEFFLRWLHQVCKSFTPLKLKNKLDWNSEVHVFFWMIQMFTWVVWSKKQ